MDSPYWLRLISHLSASAIRDYMSCEAKAAYTRNFLGVPTVAKPVGMMAGVMYHWLMQYLGQFFWKQAVRSGKKCIGEDDHKKFVSFGGMLMTKMLAGKIGSRGPGSPPESFAYNLHREAMTEKDYLEQIESINSRYIGTTYLALEALRQEFTVPLPFTNMHFEYNIGKVAAQLVSRNKAWQFRLNGSIDLIEEFPNGYNLIDYKSGWIVSKYKDRWNLIEDVQMSLYWYAMHNITGLPPTGLFIQPLEFSKKYLETYGPETLRSLRISLPLRKDRAYFDELMKLSEDIYQMVNFVVRKNAYSEKERQKWKPKSAYARKAGFSESVVEQRFKPRIGPWCSSCQYVGLCHKDHLDDWEKHSVVNNEALELCGPLPPQQLIPKSEIEDEHPRLFEEPPKRAQYFSKPQKEIRKEMLDSDQFVTKAKVMPTLNKIKAMMEDLGTCPCTDLGLYPLWILEYVPELRQVNPRLSIKDVCKKCPYVSCPRTERNREDIVM